MQRRKTTAEQWHKTEFRQEAIHRPGKQEEGHRPGHPYGKSVKGNCKVVPVDGTGDGVDDLRGNHIHGEPA